VSDQKRQPRVGHRIKATDGRFYEFYVDEFQRRWWRCVEDHSELVPYNVIEEPPPSKRPHVDRRPRWEIDFEKAIHAPPFWER
jgi:hypothetical protein